jgi:hypothetical protein
LSGVLASFVALTCSGFDFAALYFGLSGLACLLCAKGGRELVLEMKKENMTSNMGDDSINSGNISTQQYAPVAILEEDKEEEKKKKKKKESNNALSENDLEFNVEDERSNARLMGASTMSSSSNATTEASEGTEGAADEPPIKKETWLFRFAVFLTFTVTLTAFPAITSSIVTRAEMNNNSGSDDSNGASTDGDYWTSFLFLLFNLGDLAGRVFEGSSYAHSRGLQNVTGQVAFRRSLYRIVFVPLLASCNVNRSGWRIPRVFSFDSFPILFVFLLGFTNGFNAACSMALGPQTLSSDHHSPRSDEIENEDIEIENPPSLVSSSLTTERTNEDEEKEDVAKSEEGAFLGTMLSAGIAFGSVVSVLVCGIFTSGGYL